MKFKGSTGFPDLDFDQLAEITEGYNCADIADGFVEKMKQSAIDRSLEMAANRSRLTKATSKKPKPASRAP
jgi:SpoVK/Ycf46/Vps4 family AAA+-type ATPase